MDDGEQTRELGTADAAADAAADDVAGAQDAALFSRLPFEILAAILAQIALDSPRAFVRTQLIGRPLWIPHDSALLWEPICRSVYPELDRGLVHADDYGGYYQMFRRRPAVRHNGVYVCVSRYFREGEPDGISFFRPRLEVRYYRYLWLHSDGTARSLLSNHDPRVVLALDGTAPHSVHQDAMHGHWELNKTTRQLSIVVDGGKRRNNFHFEMEVASSGGKIHNKLKWKRYWSEEHGTANTADYGFRNEGSYYFYRLR